MEQAREESRSSSSESLKKYLKEISRLPRITALQERELGAKAVVFVDDPPDVGDDREPRVDQTTEVQVDAEAVEGVGALARRLVDGGDRSRDARS